MAIMLAGNSMSVGNMGKLAAKLTGSDNTIVSEVKAAEASIFKGDYTYLQNTANNPNPAVVPQADGNIAVAMFNGTMIQINTAANVVPAVVAASGVSAAATPTGIAIAATATGTGIVQVKDTVTGKVAVIGINVVAGAGAPSATQTTQTTQVASSAYSYADNHKIISSDGLLELNLDAMTYNSSTEAFKPIIYYGADGILTVEAWGGQGVFIPVTVHKDGYELAGSMKYANNKANTSSELKGATDKKDGKRRIVVGGSSKGRNDLLYYSIKQVGKENTVAVNGTTLLPIRAITLEDRDIWGNHVPETPISLTVK